MIIFEVHCDCCGNSNLYAKSLNIKEGFNAFYIGKNKFDVCHDCKQTYSRDKLIKRLTLRNPQIFRAEVTNAPMLKHSQSKR